MTIEEENKIKRSVRNWNGGVLFAILLQSYGAIWWAAQISASLQTLKETSARQAQAIVELTSDKYSAKQAEKDSEAISVRLKDIEARLRAIEIGRGGR